MRGIRLKLFDPVTTVPPILNQQFFPSLNGLRAISILFVIMQHYLLLYNGIFPGLLYIGGLGVDIFFVISGFLITTLLIKEQITTGTISLKNFYIKRALRILPIAYLYIAVIALLNYFFKLDIALSSFMFAALFLMNLSVSRAQKFDWYLAHYWSLSTEEQFYAFFPILLKKAPKIFASLVIIIVFATPFLYLLISLFPAINFTVVAAAIRYFIKFQGIGVGCLISVLLFKNAIIITKHRLKISLLCIVLIFLIKYDNSLSVQSVFKNLITSIAIGVVIICNIQKQRSWLFHILNIKLINFVGILSYSIYIWQQLFMSNDSKFPASQIPYNLFLLVIIPILSYYCFEKYFLKIKNRISLKIIADKV